MRVWKVLVLLNLALGVGIGLGYLRWTREVRGLQDAIGHCPTIADLNNRSSLSVRAAA